MGTTKYQQIINQFIWDNKPPQIKYQTLIAPIAKGDLNLQDLKTKIEEIEEIPKHKVKKIITKKVQEKFYTDMFQTWSKLNYIIPETVADIIVQPLGHNDLIQIDKNNNINVQWKQAGINHILHIKDTNGKIRSKQNLENKYGINIKFMEYNSIIHSIPKQRKQKLKDQTSTILGTKLENHCSIKINNKYQVIKGICIEDIYYYILDKA
jgi:plasmid maintenance system killer protein